MKYIERERSQDEEPKKNWPWTMDRRICGEINSLISQVTISLAILWMEESLHHLQVTISLAILWMEEIPHHLEWLVETPIYNGINHGINHLATGAGHEPKSSMTA